MSDPIAYFVTWTTYGTWLPGDGRGWAKKRVWGVQPPDSQREAIALASMTEDAVILTVAQRAIVDAVIVEHCGLRRWVLHARNVRSNHVHVVVTADAEPDKVREQLKAWSSRRLSEHAGLIGGGKHGQRRWWTEEGDIEFIYNEDHLANVSHYVLEGQ